MYVLTKVEFDNQPTFATISSTDMPSNPGRWPRGHIRHVPSSEFSATTHPVFGFRMRHDITYFLNQKGSNPLQYIPVCNFGKETINEKGHYRVIIMRKLSSSMCEKRNIPLCIAPCFELYHTTDKYKDHGFQHH